MDKKIKLGWYENYREFIDPVEFYLKKHFEVQVFGSADTAEEEIVKCRPDIILFDFHMEHLSGVQLFTNLKKKQFDFDFVPAFLTIWAGEEATVSEILKAGIEKEAIFDKYMEPDVLSLALYNYYNSKKNIS